jgi:hypothetical protein
MKPNTIPTMLIAPCGMNCRLCGAFSRDRNACPGCRGDDSAKPKSCALCRIKTCEKLVTARAKYCYSCDSFPCDRLRHLDRRYRTNYGMSMIDNLRDIRTSGVRHFVRSEKTKWTCPECGALLCVHEPQCLHCQYRRVGMMSGSGLMMVKQTKLLDEQDHKLLALWAADCAGHVLPLFETKYAADDRPRKALEAARAWARGEIRVGEARSAALAAHAAARDADDAAACAAARAAGHAAATAHVAGHARGAASYAVKAVKAVTGSDATKESDWQYERLAEHLRPVAFPVREP